MKKSFLYISVLASCFFILFGTIRCTKEHYTQLTTTDVNIVDYMRRYPSQFSEFVKILDRTNISPFLNAYGTYTCFAPTNDAIKLYLAKIGKSSTDDIDTAALKAIIRLHLIQDTISTLDFTDGKLFQPTMYGQYLITGVNEQGITVVNRQADIIQPNVLTGNGYIHVIDHVLQPATLTLAQTIEQNSKYSIFTQALKATGLYDTLNITNNPDTTRRWYTVLAESDSVLNLAGYPNYAALVTRFNNTGNPRNPNDSLYLYIAYHVLTNIKYLADIVSAPSHPTLAPLTVITQTLNGETILLNQATFNGVFEAGIPIDRANSDISCTNGALHTLLGDIYLKVRTPVRIDFDVAAQPEIVKLTSIYRRPGQIQTFALGSLADVNWQYSASTPQYTAEPATSTNYYWWNDHFDFNMRFGNAAANAWIEFRTPLLVKGQYKVWIDLRASSTGKFVQVSFDGVPTSRLIDFNTPLNTALSGAPLEATGYKRYSNGIPATKSTQFGALAGEITVLTTDRHLIRFTCVKDFSSGAKNTTTLDFIQFIPVTDDQENPTFKTDGTIVP